MRIKDEANGKVPTEDKEKLLVKSSLLEEVQHNDNNAILYAVWITSKFWIIVGIVWYYIHYRPRQEERYNAI